MFWGGRAEGCQGLSLDLLPCFCYLVPPGPWLPTSVPLMTPSHSPVNTCGSDAPACPSTPPSQTRYQGFACGLRALRSSRSLLLPGNLSGLSTPGSRCHPPPHSSFPPPVLWLSESGVFPGQRWVGDLGWYKSVLALRDRGLSIRCGMSCSSWPHSLSHGCWDSYCLLQEMLKVTWMRLGFQL